MNGLGPHLDDWKSYVGPPPYRPTAGPPQTVADSTFSVAQLEPETPIHDLFGLDGMPPP